MLRTKNLASREATSEKNLIYANEMSCLGRQLSPADMNKWIGSQSTGSPRPTVLLGCDVIKRK